MSERNEKFYLAKEMLDSLVFEGYHDEVETAYMQRLRMKAFEAGLVSKIFHADRRKDI